MGSLVSDAGRKIARINYDLNNSPVRIQFTNGNVTKYVYSATGEKLRVIYQTSVYPEDAEIVGIGKTKELSQEEIKCTETVDYLLGGALTLRNGVIDKYQFEEGYCQATPIYDDKKNPIAESFTFCYYDQDHLGNIRQVTMDDGSSKGEVIQTMDYYPFGAEFCNNSTKSFVQNHKYNGKEFDNMHGLNTYDYGARQYNPVTARWDRMDPLCEKYYSTSPYAYCANNPVRFIDPDGKKIEIYKNSSQEFINKYEKARAYLIEKGCGDILEKLENSPVLFIIKEAKNNDSHFNSKTNMIWWDPYSVTVTNEDKRLSPATTLNHEADHALQKLEMSEKEFEEKSKKGSDPDYGTVCDRLTIQGAEQRTALALGEIEEGEVTRKDHDAHAFESTDDPTKTR